jgi:hypothetical protein
MTGSCQGDYRFVRKAAGGKSETRNPKSEGNPKAEIRDNPHADRSPPLEMRFQFQGKFKGENSRTGRSGVVLSF